MRVAMNHRVDKGSCTSFPLFFFFFQKKTCVPSPWLAYPPPRVQARGGAVVQRLGWLGRLPGGSRGSPGWWPAGRVGWEKNVSVGCCFRGRKRPRAIAGGGRGRTGAECGLSLRRNIPSRNSSHPPPSFHPSSSPHSCPLGRPGIRAVFQAKKTP